ncbi:putative receptor-like protein kinase At4g00960 [Neltuma alba]|uniref:putative receptor-like protein kinase At4g00960 n=1 Tax=Neltuma alba TaxID=207710 RepID=UPI0010A341D0|nr:putative receptor-like protein kinase At4g00960 [Prosopis alba]
MIVTQKEVTTQIQVPMTPTSRPSFLVSLPTTQTLNMASINSSYGQNPDVVHAFGFCRGDVKPDSCRSCLLNAAILLPQLCPNQKEEVGYYDNCTFRYSHRSLFGIYNVSDRIFFAWSQQSSTTLNDIYVQVQLDKVEDQAPIGDSHRKFAAANDSTSESGEVYAFAQCSPDLSEDYCRSCLQNVSSRIQICCDGRNGGRVFNPSCYIRYESYLFYDYTAVSTQPPPPPSTAVTLPQGGSDSTGSQTAVKITVPIIVAVIFCCLVGCYLLRRKTRKRSQSILTDSFGEEGSNLRSLQFSLVTIEAATNKFSEENKIGKGGFGEVYKGVLPDGREIAVKRLSKSSGQGTLEFKNEILLIAKLQHRNLVTLLGFCLEEQEKILIYEYVPNKSIDFFLFDPEKQRVLDWFERFKIIRGIAQGLCYMHQHSRLKVIHRDLKLCNILLDDKMNPKISDFGMARMIAIDEDQGSTKRIVGTYGYMAPEYLIYGHFSEKSDVFSFGVIILELLSGKKNAKSYESFLLADVWKHWKEGTPLQILDPCLMESSCQIEAMRCVQIGLVCVQKNPDERPTMAEVVSYLSNLSIELPSPTEPPFLIHLNPTMSTECSSDQTTQSSKTVVSNEISITEILPR